MWNVPRGIATTHRRWSWCSLREAWRARECLDPVSPCSDTDDRCRKYGPLRELTVGMSGKVS